MCPDFALHLSLSQPINSGSNIGEAQGRRSVTRMQPFCSGGVDEGRWRLPQSSVPRYGAASKEAARPGRLPAFDANSVTDSDLCDMEFDYGWNELARKGAEIVASPSIPADCQPAFRALQNRCYVISNTGGISVNFDPDRRESPPRCGTNHYAVARTGSQVSRAALADRASERENRAKEIWRRGRIPVS